MTDLEDVATWSGKQSLAARLASAMRSASGYSKTTARRLADLERVANWDKKITQGEMVLDHLPVRVRAGEWE